MKNEKRLFSISISFTTLTLIILSILFFSSIITEILFKSFLFGILLTTLNFIIGMIFIVRSINKPENIFLIFLWGGLIFRLVIILSTVVFILIFLEINRGGFIFSVFIFYVFYLIIEILYLNLRRIDRIDSKQ